MKVLLVHYDKCTGCRICELVCSAQHYGRFQPASSRIRVVKHDRESLDVPFLCIHCEAPVCVKVCPSGALSRDEERGVVSLDEEKCINCNLCVIKCPYHGAFKDSDGKTIKCDLCGGEPQCVKFCPTQALEYAELTPEVEDMRRSFKQELLELLRTHSFVSEAVVRIAQG